jgi:hypothetical protein
LCYLGCAETSDVLFGLMKVICYEFSQCKDVTAVVLSGEINSWSTSVGRLFASKSPVGKDESTCCRSGACHQLSRRLATLLATVTFMRFSELSSISLPLVRLTKLLTRFPYPNHGRLRDPVRCILSASSACLLPAFVLSTIWISTLVKLRVYETPRILPTFSSVFEKHTRP